MSRRPIGNAHSRSNHGWFEGIGANEGNPPGGVPGGCMVFGSQGQIEALIFSATSGETHFDQMSSWFSRK